MVLRPVEIHTALIPGCGDGGFAPDIDLCAIPETATLKWTNLVTVFALPGVRSKIVPPDQLDKNCATTSFTCVATVFDSASIGSWMSTSAAFYGELKVNRLSGYSEIKVASPHFQVPVEGRSSAVNVAWVKTYFPSGYLQSAFGLVPSGANEVTLPVLRTIGQANSRTSTSYVQTVGGLVLDTQGITFSAPTISIGRVLQVKKGKSITSGELLTAAGLRPSSKFGRANIRVNTKYGMKLDGTRFKFMRAGEVSVTITYPSSRTSRSTRILQVQVG
jgi:hypothetical protein